MVKVEHSGELVLLRAGSLTVEAIEEVLDVRPSPATRSYLPTAAADSPGMLANHYAPRTPMFLLPRQAVDCLPGELSSLDRNVGYGLLLQREHDETELNRLLEPFETVQVRTLSTAGDPAEMAKNLFATLRQLDENPAVESILAEPVSGDQGLLYAIADRLRKASGGTWGE